MVATSARNAWAVGGNINFEEPLIEHWNGSAWKRVPIAPGEIVDGLFGVAATSARNAWAVGRGIVHWNGSAWKSQALGLL